MAISPSRGSLDILPSDTPRWRQLEELAHRLALQFGYQEIRTPAFESSEVFANTLGDDNEVIDKELYTFRDRTGRSLTLRPEFTVPTVRASIEHGLHAQSHLKAYYIGEVWRYERPQTGRVPEAHQFGAEVVGAPSSAVDAELVDLALTFLHALGLEDLRLEVNSVGCKKCRSVYQQVLRDFFLGKDDVLCQDCERRKERNPLRILDCRKESCIGVTNTAPTVFQSLCPDCRNHFFSFKDHLTQMGHTVNGNLRVVHNRGYYSRNVWQIVSTHLGAFSPLCTGGRFDELVGQMGTSPAPGVGLAIALDRTIAAMEKEGLPPAAAPAPEVFMVGAGEEAERVMSRVIHQLRKRGHRVDRDYSGRGIKNQTKAAEKSGATFVVLVGEEETRVSQVTVTDAVRGAQETVSVSRLVDTLEYKIRRETRDRDRDRDRGRDRDRADRGRRAEGAEARPRHREEPLEREPAARIQEERPERESRGRDESGRRGRGRRIEVSEDESAARFDEWAAAYSEAARNAPERPPRPARLTEQALTHGLSEDEARARWAEVQKGLLTPLNGVAVTWPEAPVPLSAPIPVAIPEIRVRDDEENGDWMVETRGRQAPPAEDGDLLDDGHDDGDDGDEGEDGLAAVGSESDGAGGERRRRGGRRGGRRHGRRRPRKS